MSDYYSVLLEYHHAVLLRLSSPHIGVGHTFSNSHKFAVENAFGILRDGEERKQKIGLEGRKSLKMMWNLESDVPRALPISWTFRVPTFWLS